MKDWGGLCTLALPSPLPLEIYIHIYIFIWHHKWVLPLPPTPGLGWWPQGLGMVKADVRGQGLVWEAAFSCC